MENSNFIERKTKITKNSFLETMSAFLLLGIKI